MSVIINTFFIQHPSNILVHQHTIKIADFGCSRLHGIGYQQKRKTIWCDVLHGSKISQGSLFLQTRVS